MATDTPSLYPRPMSSNAAPVTNSTNANWTGNANSPAHPHQEILPSEYELLLEIPARVTEFDHPTSASGSIPQRKRLTEPIDGLLRIIQGPLPPSSSEISTQSIFYHAFLSIGSVNIPLLPSCTASRPQEMSFHLMIPDRAFALDVITNDELAASFESLLRWFCQWRSTDGTTTSMAPTGATATPPGAAVPPSTPAQSPLQASNASSDRFATAGDKGVELVERIGTALHSHINRALEQRRDALPEENTREVKLGGRVTSSLLSSTRKVIGVGATVASKLTDRISSVVGSKLADNSATRSMSTAPEGSTKRTVYDNLMSGLLAFGRIYVAADAKGKIILEDAGTRAEQIAHRKYGPEAASASRNISGIALDGYRIARFPQKLGATALVRGAVKSRIVPPSEGDPAVARRPLPGPPPAAVHPGYYYDTAGMQWNDVSEEDVSMGRRYF